MFQLRFFCYFSDCSYWRWYLPCIWKRFYLLSLSIFFLLGQFYCFVLLNEERNGCLVHEVREVLCFRDVVLPNHLPENRFDPIFHVVPFFDNIDQQSHPLPNQPLHILPLLKALPLHPYNLVSNTLNILLNQTNIIPVINSYQFLTFLISNTQN